VGESQQLVQWLHELTYPQLPEQVVDQAKALVLDHLGCQLAGATLPWSRSLLAYFRSPPPCPGESTVVCEGFKASVHDAAYLNACFGRSTEVDDIDEKGKCHLGSMVIPAALAAGEREGASGRDLLRAIVAGYEAGSRLSLAIRSSIVRGFHPTTLVAPLAAAVTVGLLLKLSEKELLGALGIAASHASGLMEFTLSGGSVNRLHGGIGAGNGVRSAYLAQRGFNGPKTILEGEKGFCAAFANDRQVAELTRDLGRDYRILGVGLRRYCCCGTQGPGLDALEDLLTRHPFAPREIQEIVVEVPRNILRLVGTIREPEDATGAQYSGRFGIAQRILKGGSGFKQYYQEDNLRDPEILSLIGKIRYVLDESLEQHPSAIPTRLTVRLTDGTVFRQQVASPKGGVERPFSREERLAKFRTLASVALPDQEQRQAIIGFVDGLEKLDDLGLLTALLSAR
jgi:2-methylcitrate dehydratase PrpD